MTVNFIKLILLPALLWWFPAGSFAGAVSVHTDSKHLASVPGIIRPFGNGGFLTQTPGGGPGQNRREAPAGKRKSLHEYGPEDLLPEAREGEAPRPRMDQVLQPRTSNRNPLASIPTITPSPIETPTPTVTLTPMPAESAVPATAMTPSEPLKVKNSGMFRRKLLISLSLFLLLFLFLVYFVAKMRRQLRENREAVMATTSPEKPPTAEGRQLRADVQAAAERRV